MRKTIVFAAAGILGTAAAIGFAQDRGAGGFGPPGNRLVSVLDADRDGTISASEIQGAASALRSLDANADGRLTADELRPAFGRGGLRGRGEFGARRGPGEEGERAGAGPAMSAGDLADTLMAFDRNGDGKLDRAEVPERFQGLFDRADANKDGVLTKDELTQTATASMQEGDRAGRGRRGEGRAFGPGGRGMAFADPIMGALDADHDGVLSAAEIADTPAALRSLDVNHDGQLSADEFRPAFGRGRGEERHDGDGR